jgi:hypothetical protein
MLEPVLLAKSRVKICARESTIETSDSTSNKNPMTPVLEIKALFIWVAWSAELQILTIHHHSIKDSFGAM